jgi:lipid II:glycine glycyltransferase (peptidoglycan interpeptide bridge formation enzyme)
MAQVLFRRRGSLSLAYVPRGPVIAPGNATASALAGPLDEVCARHRAIVMVIEPDRPLPPAWTDGGAGFASGPERFQPSRTVKVGLAPDAEILARMRKDTRYNISHARRHGIVIQSAPVETATVRTFYRLLRETSQRNGFRIHPSAYYEDFLRVFADQAILLFARVEGVVTAGLIAARCGDEARSMYAGSASGQRARGDTALLRFEAMRWAREHGCTRYDLGGIAPEAPPAATGREVETAGGRDSALDGVDHFKVGFGGQIVTYPPTVERRYRPGLAWLLRRFHRRFRTAPGS